MIGQILSSVTGLATSWLDSKAQQKLLETEIRKKQLTGEIDWELEAIRSAQNVWKDELWTIVFVMILAANFIPSWQDAMEPVTLLEKYADAREIYYKTLDAFSIYGRGWLRRNEEVLEKAKTLVVQRGASRFCGWEDVHCSPRPSYWFSEKRMKTLQS